jgi:hypothetical protein
MSVNAKKSFFQLVIIKVKPNWAVKGNKIKYRFLYEFILPLLRYYLPNLNIADELFEQFALLLQDTD